jgi:hypothetical protein
MQLPSSSPRSRIKLALLAFAAATIVPAAFVTASTASDGTDIDLEVYFCDGDLVCDPEENYGSCPSDCASPTPEPDPGPDEDDGGRPDGHRDVPVLIIPPNAGGSTSTVVTVTPEGIHQTEGQGPGISSYGIPDGDGPTFTSLDATIDERTNVVTISWESDGSYVRILRSEEGFPTSPFEGGYVVYEGRGDEFVDYDIETGKTYYYSIFKQGSDGAYGQRQMVIVKVVESIATTTESTSQSGPWPFGGVDRNLFWLLILIALIAALIRFLFTR